MAKIFVLIGKSASGKDTLYNRLLAMRGLPLKKIVLYTTRPIRSGEMQGREYYFVTEAELQRQLAARKVIEHRVYETMHGPWHYFIADDGQIERDGQQSYLVIDTLEGYLQLAEYFGREFVVPLYIEVEDGARLSRALERERGQAEPKYAEMCRRFLADEGDFSEEKLAAAGISKRFSNVEMAQCLETLAEEIRLFSTPSDAANDK